MLRLIIFIVFYFYTVLNIKSNVDGRMLWKDIKK